MQDQITVRLPSELGRALRRESRRLRRKPSEVVRTALASYLQGPSVPDERPVERVRPLIGSLTSGVPDLAERHREFVLESIRRGR